MRIDLSVIEKLEAFEKTTGIKPTAIYLGWEEAFRFKEWIFKEYDGRTFSMDDGPEFNGIKLYEVSTKNHLAVS